MKYERKEMLTGDICLFSGRLARTSKIPGAQDSTALGTSKCGQDQRLQSLRKGRPASSTTPLRMAST